MLLVAALLALPLVGLAVLVGYPEADFQWRHQPSHFWLVLTVAVVSVVLAFATGEAARRRGDARVFLVGLAFLVAAGFLGLHALATPGVLLDAPNTGFVIATPVGLLLASGFAAASAVYLSPSTAAAIMRHQRILRGAVFAVLALWAAGSLGAVPPLDDRFLPERLDGPLVIAAAVGVGLYAFAALRYLDLWRERRAILVAAIGVAFVLLGEAMVAIAAARNWHASWWEWHVLMAIAFGLVALAARSEYARQASVPSTFTSLYLEHTLGRVDRERATALEELVSAQVGSEELRRRLGMAAEEVEVLERAAGEIRRLDELFRPYLSPQLADRLREDPAAGELGGEQRQVSILFADLQGFTTFSERAAPSEVMEMLNEYWGGTVPVLEAEGGLIERFAGDAVMVVFNAAGDQDDHAARACRAALELQRTSGRIADRRPGCPRFRAGVNTGLAVIGNVGSAERRSFTAIGDTTNLAARLQAQAEPGQVVIGAATLAALADGVQAAPLGPLELKGKSEPVEAYVLQAFS
jgi:class 3 adenylate cyclase